MNDHQDYRQSSIFPQHWSPLPKKWKGCYALPIKNNKVIGAVNLVDVFGSPSDDLGHGTFVSSIDDGNFILNFDQD
ncbi:hypothetical protein OSB04_003333 [Centaurea solstitialis]|uniref:Uncharacterized protein n=1 Tax=Centaurea solstitialis TaxID=347529 RepID=A0AA38WNN3_9ASTR|nr:hypothetical protein OSB04_003333 [Centaurea solstitialis]